APTPSPSRRTSAHYARSSPTRRARKPSSADRLSSSAGLRWSLTVYAWSSSQLSSSAARTAQSLRSPQSFQPSEWRLSYIQSFSSNRSFHRFESQRDLSLSRAAHDALAEHVRQGSRQY